MSPLYKFIFLHVYLFITVFFFILNVFAKIYKCNDTYSYIQYILLHKTV